MDASGNANVVADEDLPDIHALSRVLDRALWVLASSKREGYDYLSAPEIVRRLIEVHRIATHASAVRMALRRAPASLVHAKKQHDGNAYAIMKKGEKHLSILGGPRVVLIDPDKAYGSRRKVEEFFQSCTDRIRICDPYVDAKTLDPLTAIPKGSEIRLLTSKVHDRARVRREIEAYGKEYSILEVRVSQDSLHDRYIILKDKLWLVGHSLNGLGKKEAFIVNLGKDMRSEMEMVFDRRWAISPVL
ncbi:MAG: hypothetical protein ACREIN_03070 [Candidatus Methylomirabilaceae bacterium]